MLNWVGHWIIYHIKGKWVDMIEVTGIRPGRCQSPVKPPICREISQLWPVSVLICSNRTHWKLSLSCMVKFDQKVSSMLVMRHASKCCKLYSNNFKISTIYMFALIVTLSNHLHVIFVLTWAKNTTPHKKKIANFTTITYIYKSMK